MTGGMNSHTGTFNAANTINNKINMLVPSRCIFICFLMAHPILGSSLTVEAL